MAEEPTPERPQPGAFERAFDAGKREYEVFGGKYEVLGNKIEAHILTHENPTDPTPVVLAPGFGETPDVFKKSAETVFNSGRSVIILDHPRHASVFDKETLSEIGEGNEMTVHELRKAATLLHIFDEEGITQADVIAHSEAAINVALAATLAPDKFRDVVLSNPAGLIGKDKPLKLITRNTRKDAHNVLQVLKGNIELRTEGRALKEGIKYIFKNLLRTLGEVREISNAELEDTLRDLHDHGMGIAIMAGVDDRTFTMDRIQNQVSSDHVPGGFVDGFASVRGGHDDLHANPDQYTGAALGLLTTLNNKRRAERENAPDTPPPGKWEELGIKRAQKAKEPNLRTRLGDKRTVGGDHWLKKRAESGNFPGLEKPKSSERR